MKKIIITLSLLSVLSCFSQETKQEPEKCDFTKFRVGICLLPDAGYRLLSNGGVRSSYLDYRNSHEYPFFCYNAGLTFGYYFRPRLGVSLDVLYSQKRYRGDKYEGREYSKDGYLISSYTYFYIDQLRTLDIPVRVNFTSGKKRVLFSGSLGVVTNIILEHSYLIKKIYESESKTTDVPLFGFSYSSVFLSGELNVGAEIILNKLMRIKLQPSFRQAFTPWYTSDKYGFPISEFRSSVGMNVSYLFCF